MNNLELINNDPRTGRFVAGNKAACESPARALQRAMQEWLTSIDEAAECNLNIMDRRTKLHAICQSLYDMASDSSNRNAVAAANVLFNRAYGTELPSEEALDALAQGGLKVVVVGLPEPQDVNLKPSEPQFIEGEVIEG